MKHQASDSSRSKSTEPEGEDSDSTNTKLAEAAEAAHVLMTETLHTLDVKIKDLFNAQRAQLAKAAQQHQQALKIKVKEFQAEVAKYVGAEFTSLCTLVALRHTVSSCATTHSPLATRVRHVHEHMW